MEIIHIVLGKANPDRLNGVNKVVYHLATEQSKAGKKIQVWGITPNPVHNYPDRNFNTVLFKAEKFPFFINKKLKNAVLANKKAVFHIHGGWVPVFSTLSRLFAKNRIKYVLTPHGAYNEVAMKRSAFQKKIYFQLFEKVMLQQVHKVHSIGSSEVAGLRKLVPKAQSFLLPYGFESNQYSSELDKSQDFIIGFVGRLDTHTKGLDLLIEAFEIFQSHHPESKLWIIGDGEGKAYLEHYVQAKKMSNVKLWGKKFGEEKDTLISKMHVFAHPSRNEGLPTAVLEAAALGTPTIVTQATNVAEYVSAYKAGIAIDNDNVTELVRGFNQLHKAYQTGEALHFVTGAKKMLDEVFSWSVLVEKYDELYQ